MKQICILLLTFGFISCHINPSQHQQFDFTPLDSVISCWMTRNYYPRSSIAIANKDTLLFEKYYGNYTPDTEVYITSAGKWIEAATIAAIVEKTCLSWDDTLAQWIPEFKDDPKASITLRQLLLHTSETTDYYQPPKKDVFMQLAEQMAEIAGQSDFETLFKRHIGNPLNMNHTSFIPVESEKGQNSILAREVRTTLNDYMNFLNMIFHNGTYNNKQVLSEQSILEIQSDQVNCPGWAGTSSWIDKNNEIYALFLTHVEGYSAQKDNFSPYYSGSILSEIVSDIIKKNN